MLESQIEVLKDYVSLVQLHYTSKDLKLVTQYGLGKPYEENRLAQKIVRNCGQESFVGHLQDTSDNRFIHYNKALQTLSGILKNNVHPDISKVILPIGIGHSLVDKQWLCRYHELIKKFAHEISYSGVQCYIAVRKPYLNAIDKFAKGRNFLPDL